MYAENALNLLTLLETVPALAVNSGLAAGGRASDPSMIHIPLPCAWVIMADDKPNDPPTGSNPAGQVVSTDYIVMLHVPYTSQADLLANQLPLLEAAVTAVRGKAVSKRSKMEILRTETRPCKSRQTCLRTTLQRYWLHLILGENYGFQ